MPSPRILNLRPASFRGVPFEVDDASYEGGRRVQVHEYPQRDVPYAEDLGRSARGLTFSAFVVGDDYIERANRLIAALESAGPGTLIHPWMGTLQVSIKDNFRVRYSRTAVGVATFELSFVEAGELAFPAATTSTPTASRLAADALNKAAAQDFTATYKTAGLPDFVGAAASGNWAKVMQAVSIPTPGLEAIKLSNRLATVASSVLSTSTQPSTIPGLLVGAMGLAPLANTTQRWAGIVQGLLRLAGNTALRPPAASSITTPSRRQATANVATSNALVRLTLLSQAVGASSLIPVVVVDDALAIRKALTTALDDEALTASTDATYTALQAARAAVWADLAARARDAARLRTITPSQTCPALVIAYDLYADAARADEICARNRIRHPGFVPPAPLQVLSV